MTPSEQQLFERLAVFHAGCTLEAAEAVANANGQFGSTLLDYMGALVDKSLLQRLDGLSEEPRYGLLETIREFALEQLLASGQAHDIRQRHVDYFVNLGEQAAPELLAGPQHVSWIRRLGQERHNLRAALVWCVENGEVERGLQLGGALAHYWYRIGSFDEVRDWRQALLRFLPGAGRTRLVARALNAVGQWSIILGDFPTARAMYTECLVLGRELNDHGRIASALGNLGMVALREGDPESARRLLEEAVAEARSAGDGPWEATKLGTLGDVLTELGEYESACARYGESASLYMELGDTSGAASALSRQGSAARAAGDFVSAEALCEESLRLAHESGDRREVGWSYLRLGFVRLHQADYGNARELFLRCLQQWDGSASVGHCCGYATQGLACLAASLGQADRAMRLFGAAEAIDRVRWRAAGLSNSFGFGASFSIPHWRALASSALDEEAAAKAVSAGRSMSEADAMAYALKPVVDSASAPADGMRVTERENGLTPREQEVTALLAGGRTNREIAETLVITVSTAECHVANILNKLGLRSRTEVALWAVAQSLEGSPEKSAAPVRTPKETHGSI